MIVNGVDRIADFESEHPDACKPLARWCLLVGSVRWSHFANLRETLGSADTYTLKSGKTVVIFNVGGNKFRLVAYVEYKTGLVVVRNVLTHDEYNTDKWKDEP